MRTYAFALLACALWPTPALADQDVINEDWIIAAGDVRAMSFSLNAPAAVRIDMTPVKDAAKGVTLRLVPTEDADACAGRAQGRCRSRPGFDGFKVGSFSHAEQVPAGTWTFYVANTENILKSATVHIHLVVNP